MPIQVSGSNLFKAIEEALKPINENMIYKIVKMEFPLEEGYQIEIPKGSMIIHSTCTDMIIRAWFLVT